MFVRLTCMSRPPVKNTSSSTIRKMRNGGTWAVRWPSRYSRVSLPGRAISRGRVFQMRPSMSVSPSSASSASRQIERLYFSPRWPQA
jgi:hypothetical protein